MHEVGAFLISLLEVEPVRLECVTMLSYGEDCYMPMVETVRLNPVEDRYMLEVETIGLIPG